MIHRGDSADKAKSLFRGNASIIPREYRATLRPLVVDYPGSCYLKLKAICYQNGTKIPVNGKPAHWHNFTPPYIEEKAENIKRRGGCTLKELQSFLGKLEASSAAIIIARLHFRFMQALLRGKEDDKEFIKFNEKAKIDLQWWIDFARKHSTSPLQAPRLAKLNIKRCIRRRRLGRTFQKRMDTSKMGEKRETQAYKLEGDGSSEEMHSGTDEVQRTRADRDGLIDFHVHHQLHGQINQCNTETEGSGDMGNSSQQPGMVDSKMDTEREEPSSRLLVKTQNPSMELWFKRRSGIQNIQKGKTVSGSIRLRRLPCIRKVLRDESRRTMEGGFQPGKVASKSFTFPPVPLLQLALNRIKEEKIKAIVVAPESTATWWYNLKDLSIDSITLGKARKVCNRGKQKLPYIGRLEAHLIDQRDR